MIDLGFEIFLTLSYAWEPAEDVEMLMSVPPRKFITAESTLAIFNETKKRDAHKASNMALNSTTNLTDTHATSMLLNGDDAQEEDIQALGNKLKNRYGKHISELRTIFTDKSYWTAQRDEWRSITAHPSGERLVDGEVMLWSFIEAGLIEFSGALCTYFAILWFRFGVTADDARRGQIKGSYYWKPQSPGLLLDSGDSLSGAGILILRQTNSKL
jgi:sodium/potassium-transporting ATPase subunit alpha